MFLYLQTYAVEHPPKLFLIGIPELDYTTHTDFPTAIIMAPRSQLEITTSSVLRLVKEEASYHNELLQQAERIKKLESAPGGEDENQEYLIKQEVCIRRGVSPKGPRPQFRWEPAIKNP